MIKIFCCLSGRDEFIKVYSRLLASRLFDKSLEKIEDEIKIIQLLQIECGYSAVKSLKIMIEDIEKS